MPKIKIDPESKLTGVFIADGVKLRRDEEVEVADGHPALKMLGVLTLDEPKVQELPEPRPEPKPKKKATKKVAKKKTKKGG